LLLFKSRLKERIVYRLSPILTRDDLLNSGRLTRLGQAGKLSPILTRDDLLNLPQTGGKVGSFGIFEGEKNDWRLPLLRHDVRTLFDGQSLKQMHLTLFRSFEKIAQHR
jgi:hypothetical protein